VALADTLMTAGSGLTTASFTLTTGRLYLAACFAYSFSATVGTTSLTGWDNLGTAGGEPFNTNVCRIQVLRHVPASDSTGTLTFTNTNTGVVFRHAIIEITGHDTGGTNGSGAIVQVVDTSTTGADPNSYNLTLAALGDAVNNAVYGAFGNSSQSTSTPNGSYVELTDAGGLQVVRLLPGTTSPGITNSSAFADIGGIGIEVKAATAGGSTQPPRSMHQYRLRRAA
jgi:hypothetical protein